MDASGDGAARTEEEEPGRALRVVGAGQLGEVAAVLAAGGLAVVPTDTVYGLAARLDRPEAVRALFWAKGRPQSVAIPVLAGSPAQARALSGAWPVLAELLTGPLWPGPLTVVVPAPPALAALLGAATETVGLRVPAHRELCALATLTGPLAVTSANRHGREPCTTVAEVLEVFGRSLGAGDGDEVVPVQVVLDGGVCDGVPSTVVDCTGPVPVCLREGAIGWDRIQEAARPR